MSPISVCDGLIHINFPLSTFSEFQIVVFFSPSVLAFVLTWPLRTETVWDPEICLQPIMMLIMCGIQRVQIIGETGEVCRFVLQCVFKAL